jgi:mono/diheme cytochrome c family protein
VLKLRLRAGLGVLACAAAVSGWAQAPKPVDASAVLTPVQLADEGRRRYTLTCARCHGLNLVSLGNGFDLRTFPADDKTRFVRSVTQGLRAMPALGGALTAADVDALWAYLGAVNGWPP